jgi:hypothetical protein
MGNVVQERRTIHVHGVVKSGAIDGHGGGANGKTTHGGKREERPGPYGACGKNRVIVCAACVAKKN